MKKIIIVLLLLGCFSSISVYAQSVDYSKFELKIEELERRISLLEKIILEGNSIVDESSLIQPDLRSSSSSALDSRLSEPRLSAVNPREADLVVWRKLEFGMDEEDVKNLLGEPHEITTYSRELKVWQYLGGGYVRFDSSGLFSWDEPDYLHER